MSESINDLWQGTAELIQMGLDQGQGFAYEKTIKNVGSTVRRNDSVIEMTISENGSSINGVHESAHEYDFWKGGENTTENWDVREMKAYGRQYSYAKNSIPDSYWGHINSRCDINTGWVLGIYTVNTNGIRDYIYAKYILQDKIVLTPTQIEGFIDKRR